MKRHLTTYSPAQWGLWWHALGSFWPMHYLCTAQTRPSMNTSVLQEPWSHGLDIEDESRCGSMARMPRVSQKEGRVDSSFHNFIGKCLGVGVDNLSLPDNALYGQRCPNWREEEGLGMTEDVSGRLSHNQGRGGRHGILCKGIQSGKKLCEI